MARKQPFVHTFLLILLIIGALFAAGYAMQHTVSVVLLSSVLAYLLDPIVTLLERKKVRRTYGIIALYVVLGVFSIFCFTYLVPFVTASWDSLLKELPVYLQNFQSLANDWKERIGPSRIEVEWQWLFSSLQSNIDTFAGKFGAWIYSAVGSVVFNLLNVLLSPILVFFMLFYKADVKKGFVSMIPADRRQLVLAICRDINRSIGGFIRGQVVVSLIVAILSIVALLVLGVSHPYLCGIFAGLASIIPFVGVLLATLPPLFFAYAEYQSILIMIKVVAAFSIIYFLEGYVVKPLVFKESMDVNPLTTIVMVMAFGELMGFWGVILAIPIAASLKIITAHVRGISQSPAA